MVSYTTSAQEIPNFPYYEFDCKAPDINPAQQSSSVCSSLSDFIPTESTPIKTVRVAFHVFQLSGPNPGNFRNIPQHVDFLNAVFNRANSVFSFCANRACFCNWESNGFIRDSRIRFDLTGIYFHQDDEAFNNFNNGIYATEIHNRYKNDCPYKEQEVLNVYFTQAGTEYGGIGPPDYIHIPRLYDIYNAGGPERAWPDGNTLAHEIGHTLGLSHSWAESAEVNDLCPSEPQCNFGCPVSSACGGCVPSAECSNNVMNYSKFTTFFSPLQMAKMHRTLTTGRQKRWIAKRPGDLVEEVINNDITWDKTRYQGGSVTIKSGATLTIAACQITMAPETKIIVQRGARLIVDGAKIQGTSFGNRHLCGIPDGRTVWQGIEVWGNTSIPTNSTMLEETYPLQINDPGVVILKSNSIIEGAEKGINNRRTSGSWEIQKQHFGGLISAEKTTFLNCFKGVEMISSEALSNASVFEEVTFKQDYLNPTGSLFNTETSDYFGFTSWQVGGFQLNNCKFQDLEAGLVILNKNFSLINSTFERCEKGVMNGNVLMSTNFTSIGDVGSGNEFNNCRLAIDLPSPKNVSVFANTFIGNTNGTYVSGLSSFTIRENTINSNPSGSQPATGLILNQVSSTGVNNNVSCNQIGNNDNSRRINYATYLSGSVDNLSILKNTYNSRHDWYLSPIYHDDGSITAASLSDQGSFGKPVYNNFTVKSDAGSVIQINIATPGTDPSLVGRFDYWHPTVNSYSSRLIAECPVAWSGTQWDDCPQKHNFRNRESSTSNIDNHCSFGEINGFQAAPDCKNLACLLELTAAIDSLNDSILLSSQPTLIDQIANSPNSVTTITALTDSVPFVSENILVLMLGSGMNGASQLEVLIDNSPLSYEMLQLAQASLTSAEYASLLSHQSSAQLSIAEASKYRLVDLEEQKKHTISYLNDSIMALGQLTTSLQLLDRVGGKLALQYAISNTFTAKEYNIASEIIYGYPQDSQDDRDYKSIMRAYLNTVTRSDGFYLLGDDLELIKEIAQSRRKHASLAQLLLTGFYDNHYYPEIEEFKEPEKKVDGFVDQEKQLTPVINNLTIYPNPSDGVIHLVVADHEIIQAVRLYNILGGEVIRNVNFNTNSAKIEGLATGVYFIHCKVNDQTIIRKVVVK